MAAPSRGNSNPSKSPPEKKNETKLVPFHHGGEQAPAAAQEAEQKQKQKQKEEPQREIKLPLIKQAAAAAAE